MQKKKTLFAGILLCLIAGAAWGYYLYQKPRASLTDIKAAYTISASELYNAFEQNEQQANQKYLGKVLAVTGTVDGVQTTDSTASIQLASGNDMGGINCSLAKSANQKNRMPVKGQTIQLKGRCTGYLMDVNLTDVVIIP